MAQKMVICLAAMLAYATYSISHAQMPPSGSTNVSTSQSPAARYSNSPSKSKISRILDNAFTNSAGNSTSPTQDSRSKNPAAPVCANDPTPMARSCRDLPNAVDADGHPVSNDDQGNRRGR